MIITLPVTVKNDAPLGYWLTPVLADALSRQLGEKGVLYYGTLGLKSPDSAAEAAFHKNLDFLHITCAREPDAGSVSQLLALANEAATAQSIEGRVQDCYRCACGRLELPVKIAVYAKEKTFYRIGDSYVCRACGEVGKLTQVIISRLRLTEGNHLDSFSIYPQWYSREVKELLRQLQEQGIPWARERSTGLTVKGANIDAEIAWSFLPLMLSRQHTGERIRLIVTNHVLRQAVIALVLARIFDPYFAADLFVSPCLVHPGGIEKWRLDRLVSLGFTGPLLRLVLIGSLGWQTKDAHLYDVPASVEYRRFVLLERHVNAEGFDKPYQPQEVLNNLNQQNVVRGLKHVFNPDRFNYRTLHGLF